MECLSENGTAFEIVDAGAKIVHMAPHQELYLTISLDLILKQDVQCYEPEAVNIWECIIINKLSYLMLLRSIKCSLLNWTTKHPILTRILAHDTSVNKVHRTEGRQLGKPRSHGSWGLDSSDSLQVKRTAQSQLLMKHAVVVADNVMSLLLQSVNLLTFPTARLQKLIKIGFTSSAGLWEIWYNCIFWIRAYRHVLGLHRRRHIVKLFFLVSIHRKLNIATCFISNVHIQG